MEKTGIQATGIRLVIVLLLITAALTYTLRYLRVKPDRQANFALLPRTLGGWESQEIILSQSTYDILKATSTTMRTYTDSAQAPVGLFIGYFADQKYGSQIHSPRNCLPGGGWGILSHRWINLPVGSRVLHINRLIIGNREVRQLMYYWFETRSGLIAGEFSLKFNLFRNSLLMRPTDAAFIRLTVTLPEGRSEKYGEQVLLRFLTSLLDPIEKSLPFANK